MTDYTPILNLPEVAPNQDQKEATINTALAILEASVNDTLTISFASSDVTLNTDQFTKHFLFEATGATVLRHLFIPETNRWFAVENLGSASIIVKVADVTGGHTVELAAGKIGLLVADGTNVRVVVPDPSAGTGVLVDLSDVSGVPTDGQLLRWVAADTSWEPWTLTLAFSGLSDFPGAYGSNSTKLLAVRSDGTGLEWVTSSANINTFLDLTDTPSSYSGSANLTVKVNSGATGLIFAQPKLTDAIDFPSSYGAAAAKFLRVNPGATAVEFHVPVVADLSDGPGAPTSPNALKYIRINSGGTAWEYASGTGGPDHFYQLADVPASYVGNAGKLVKVNGSENALVYGGYNFTQLGDAPSNYSGAAGKFAQVNSGATALQFGLPKVSDLSDGPGVFTSAAKKVVRVNAGASALEYFVISFTDLATVPTSYSGSGGKFLAVKGDESGIQFVSSSVTTSFLALTDTPDSYTGNQNRSVTVDGAGTGLIFGPIVPTRLGQLADVEDGTGTPAQGSFLRWVDGVWQADVFVPGGGSGSAIVVQDEGAQITASATRLNFTGAGIQATSDGAGHVTVNVPMIPNRLGQLGDVEDGTGTPAQGAFLRWIDGVWQADPFTFTGGGGSALTVKDEGSTLTTGATSFNFTGAGIQATADGSGHVTVNVPMIPNRLGQLGDVEDGTGTPAQGSFLRWIDGVWQADVTSGGGGGGSGQVSYFGAGAPSTLHSEGDLYFDTSATYAEYVQHSGAWHATGSGASGAATYFDSGTPLTLHNDGDTYYDTSVRPFQQWIQFSSQWFPANCCTDGGAHTEFQMPGRTGGSVDGAIFNSYTTQMPGEGIHT